MIINGINEIIVKWILYKPVAPSEGSNSPTSPECERTKNIVAALLCISKYFLILIYINEKNKTTSARLLYDLIIGRGNWSSIRNAGASNERKLIHITENIKACNRLQILRNNRYLKLTF